MGKTADRIFTMLVAGAAIRYAVKPAVQMISISRSIKSLGPDMLEKWEKEFSETGAPGPCEGATQNVEQILPEVNNLYPCEGEQGSFELKSDIPDVANPPTESDGVTKDWSEKLKKGSKKAKGEDQETKDKAKMNNAATAAHETKKSGPKPPKDNGKVKGNKEKTVGEVEKQKKETKDDKHDVSSSSSSSDAEPEFVGAPDPTASVQVGCKAGATAKGTQVGEEDQETKDKAKKNNAATAAHETRKSGPKPPKDNGKVKG